MSVLLSPIAHTASRCYSQFCDTPVVKGNFKVTGFIWRALKASRAIFSEMLLSRTWERGSQPLDAAWYKTMDDINKLVWFVRGSVEKWFIFPFWIIQLHLIPCFEPVLKKIKQLFKYFFHYNPLFDKISGTRTGSSEAKSSLNLYLITQNVVFILLVDLYHCTGADSWN